MNASDQGEEGLSAVAKGIRDLAEAVEKLASEPESDDVFLRTVAVVREHPGVALTVLYVYASAVGGLYTWSLFRQFGVTILDFAQATDFLLAAFKQPVALIVALCAGTVAAALVYFAFLRQDLALFIRVSVSGMFNPLALAVGAPALVQALLRMRKREKEALDTIRRRSSVIVAATFVAASLLFGLVSGANIKGGNAPRIGVELKNGGQQGISSCLDGSVFLIGTSQEYIFLYDRNDPLQPLTHIIPAANVLRIYQLPRGSTWCCPVPTPTVAPTSTRTRAPVASATSGSTATATAGP
jgi:hypothetical protein